jgi:hypothetical protein
VAGILALVGGALLAKGAVMDLLVLAGQVWPVILIGLGIYIAFQRRGLGEPGRSAEWGQPGKPLEFRAICSWQLANRYVC